MIWKAGIEDIPRLLEMGQRFADKAKLAEHVGYDPEHMANTFKVMIEGEDHAIFISENGAIGGMSGPHPFNYAHRIAQELFWWSEGGGGLLLLEAFEEWAAGFCQSARMATLHAIEPERTGRLFERRGYTPVEHGYIKVFHP